MAAAEKSDLVLMDPSIPRRDREKALAAGGDAYDTEPIDVTRLRDKIDALLAKTPR